MRRAEKAKAERVQEEYRSAKAIRESIERDLFVVRKDIQKAIGRFLRDAASPESLAGCGKIDLQRVLPALSHVNDLSYLISGAVWPSGLNSVLRKTHFGPDLHRRSCDGQISHAHQIVGGASQSKNPMHFADSAMAHLAH
jgi:hypothetical protein